jgi:hypothetical protein
MAGEAGSLRRCCCCNVNMLSPCYVTDAALPYNHDQCLCCVLAEVTVVINVCVAAAAAAAAA